MSVKRAWIAVGGGITAALVAASRGVAVGWHATADTPTIVPAVPATDTGSASPPPPATKPRAAASPVPAPAVPVNWVSTSVSLTEGGQARHYLLVRPAATSKTPL